MTAQNERGLEEGVQAYPTLIVDLGLGNLHSVVRAVRAAGGEVQVSDDPAALQNAQRVVVPGQGAFRDGAAAVDGEMGKALRAFLESGRPYLGICLGMQLLFDSSEEAPGARGLGWFRGSVKRFAPRRLDRETGRRLKVPHMGWNEVESEHPLLGEERWFYFVHSYYCVPAEEGLVVGRADYGEDFCAAVARGGVFACQFHPEKSHRAGRALLQRFMETTCS